jgi:hypothetical protein
MYIFTLWLPLKEEKCQALMAYTCNPSYSGGQDQEDRGLKPAWENSLQDLILKTLHKNRVGGVAQGKGLEFKPQYHKRKRGTVCARRGSAYL